MMWATVPTGARALINLGTQNGARFDTIENFSQTDVFVNAEVKTFIAIRVLKIIVDEYSRVLEIICSCDNTLEKPGE